MHPTPSPHIFPPPGALLPPVALALEATVVATTLLNTPTHCYEWLPLRLAPHPRAGKRLKTVSEEGGRGVG